MTLVLFVLVLAVIANIIEKKIALPAVFTLVAGSLIAAYYHPSFVGAEIDYIKSHFVEMVVILLPIVLLPDILKLHVSDLKKHWKHVVWLALVSVVGLFVLLITTLPSIFGFSLASVAVVAAILLTTDAVSVTTILGSLGDKVPHKLKFYVESESLFNDVTGMLLLFFVAIPLVANNFTVVSFLSTSGISISIALFASIAIGYFGYLFMKLSEDIFDELLIILIVGILSFFIAEHFHSPGIFAIVVGILSFQLFVSKEFDRTDIKIPSSTKERLNKNADNAALLATLANAFIFVFMAFVIDLNLIIQYIWYSIGVFVLFTLLRYITMTHFVKTMKLNSLWGKIMTFGGIRGALAILMLYSLPSFPEKHMVEAIVMGMVLISIFVYSPILVYISNKLSPDSKVR